MKCYTIVPKVHCFDNLMPLDINHTRMGVRLDKPNTEEIIKQSLIHTNSIDTSVYKSLFNSLFQKIFPFSQTANVMRAKCETKQVKCLQYTANNLQVKANNTTEGHLTKYTILYKYSLNF